MHVHFAYTYPCCYCYTRCKISQSYLVICIYLCQVHVAGATVVNFSPIYLILDFNVVHFHYEIKYSVAFIMKCLAALWTGNSNLKSMLQNGSWSKTVSEAACEVVTTIIAPHIF